MLEFADPYTLLRQAVAQKRRISATYEGLQREFSPSCIGTGGGHYRVLGWQDGGRSKHPLPNWRCFNINKLTNIRVSDGMWKTGGRHTRPQTCITAVDIEVFGD